MHRQGVLGNDHMFRDRLRAAGVPLEAIDQLGGWSSISSIGSSYGQGYPLEHLRKYIDAFALDTRH